MVHLVKGRLFELYLHQVSIRRVERRISDPGNGLNFMTKVYTEHRFSFLEREATDGGAIETRLIPAEGIIIENRGILKCHSGCPYYGKSLVCPPHAILPDEFRKMVREYSQALIVRFQTSAKTGDEVASSFLRTMTDPDIPSERKQEFQAFFCEFGEDGKRFYHTMLNLEKAAFGTGYPFAAALMAGPCMLCDSCNVNAGFCVNPTKRRFSADALGINIIKTAGLAGIDIRFPFQTSPSTIGILLID